MVLVGQAVQASGEEHQDDDEVGQVIAVRGDRVYEDDGKNHGIAGQWFTNERYAALREKGEWSTNMWDCQDSYVALEATFCPCWMIFNILHKVGYVTTPCCKFDRRAYAITFGLSFIPFLLIQISHVLPSLWREPDMIPWRNNEMKDALPFNYEQSAAFIVLAVTMWVLSYFVFRGVRDHYRVDEDESVTCLKSACWPDGMFCCQPFFMAQVARHVNEAQGFRPPNGAQADRSSYSRLSK